MKKLPVGIQTFEKIRANSYIYADKTKEIYDLITSYTYAFLSRPRRFGKSLLVDTLKCLFEGRKELFKGLYIYDKWEFEKYPVIKISFSGNRNEQELIKDIFKNIQYNQEKLNIECKSDDYAICFSELIINAYKKYKKRVVVLIDEYDKPILDIIENKEISKSCRELIKRLYSQIKTNDEYIKFAFLTGVSKFSKASIFSGLNMLSDISLLPKYGNICGITHQEVLDNFWEYLDGVDLKELKEWYNGYYFLKDTLYNPFDLLQYLQTKIFNNYWFSSGSPSFLIKLLQNNSYYLPNLSNLKVDAKLLDTFDIERIDIEVLLYQAGYLTIKGVINTPFGSIYKLYFPNKEVKTSFSDVLIEYFAPSKQANDIKISLYQSLTQGNIKEFIETLKTLFSSIPYTNLTHIKNYEGFYASIVYIYLQSLGFDITGEDITNKGKIDLTIFAEDKIYIIEFKAIEKKNKKCEALKQIKEKRYYEKYLRKSNTIYIAGICFGKEERNIVGFGYEKVIS